MDTAPLKGALVIAVVDNDAAGARWAANVASSLRNLTAELLFVRAAVGKDAADHVAAHRSLDELLPYVPAGTSTEPTRWSQVDLLQALEDTTGVVLPSIMPRADGLGLIYPGLTHSFHGESESGKSLLLQAETIRLINGGERVLYLDFESDPLSVGQRLLNFGATREALAMHLDYRRPDVRPSVGAEAAEWEGMLKGRYTLAIVDGVTDALGVFGFRTNDNDEVATWMREVPKRIAEETGAAVALIDHVAKDGASRGRFAIGGQAKMAALTGAAYTRGG